MLKPKISICIPTYNRADSLANCLNSIAIAAKKYVGRFEVCVSDNGSDEDTSDTVKKASKSLEINFHRNETNVGIPRNFIQVVSMAKGEFVWLIGDDDLLLPDTFDRLLPLLDDNKGIDFFYLNSFHLDKSFIDSQTHPFDTRKLPLAMKPFSGKTDSGECEFFELIDPRVSFDFLGGMFLSAFRKSKWDVMVDRLDSRAIHSGQTFSHFDNTFPHLKIFSHAFSNSLAYFNPEPLNVCLTGAREWSPMEPLVRNVRLIEALELYKKNGLPLIQYHLCRNFALSNFIPGLGYMIFNKDISGYKYINPMKIIISNCLYPRFYLSFFSFIIRKIKDKLFHNPN
jgi:glycosyltransferase involved in cell wall biosynthesis